MNCRVCDSTRLTLVLDLGLQPWCNHFLHESEVGQEPYYPLRLNYCLDCRVTQLDFTVPKETMFGDHTYLSGVTKSLSAHFEAIARQVTERFCANRSRPAVMDIGSNDGTQLKHFQKLGYDVLGVESSKTTARLAQDAGVSTLNEFFNGDLARRLDRKFDIINAAGVFFHLEELHSVTDGIRESLRDDGVFVVQFLYMPSIVRNVAFDQIYHEHLLYYTLETIEILLNRHGLAMFDCEWSPIHGGSIIGFVSHRGRLEPSERLRELRRREAAEQANELPTYQRFAERVAQMKVANLQFLEDAADQGKRVFGMGAPVKGNTLLNYFGITRRHIQCLVEKNTLRRGLFAPGTHLPILIESELPTPPDVYYVLAWNFKKEILANNQHLLSQGVEFFFPVDPQEELV